MKHTSFSDVEFASNKKQTRRERSLAEINATTWPALVAALLPHYPRGDGRSRPPICLERMLRMYIAPQSLCLSDEGIEDAIGDIQSVRAFVGMTSRTSRRLTRRHCSSFSVCLKRMR